MRRGLIIGGSILAGLALVAVAVFWFFSRSETAHRLVLERVVPTVEEAIGAKIKLDSVAGTFTGALVWRGVKMAWPDFELEIEEATLRLDFLALKDRHFHVTRLKAVNPRGVVIPLPPPKPKPAPAPATQPPGQPPATSPAGSTQPPKAASAGKPQPTEPPRPKKPDREGRWRLSLEGISISGGRMEGLGQEIDLPGLGTLHDLTGTGQLHLDKGWRALAVLKGAGDYEGRAFKMDLDGSLDRTELDFAKLNLLFGPGERSRLNLAGRFETESASGQTRFESDLEPADLPDSLGLGRLAGRLKLKGQTQGGAESLDFQAQGKWAEAQIEGQGRFQPPTRHLEVKGRFKDLNPAGLSGLAGQDLPAGRTEARYDVKGRLPDDLKMDFDFGPSRLDKLLRFESAKGQALWNGENLSGQAKVSQGQGRGLSVAGLDVTGHVGARDARLKVVFQEGSYADASAQSGRFRIERRQDLLHLADLVLEGPSGRLAGWAEASLAGERLVAGRSELEMDRYHPPVQLILDLMGLSLPLIDLSSLRLSGPLKAHWPGQAARISSPDLKLESDWGRIASAGRLDLDARGVISDYNAVLDLTRFKIPGWLAAFLPQDVLQAILSGRVRITPRSPGARLESEKLTAEGPFGRVAATGRLDLGPAGAISDYDLSLDLAGFQVPASLWPLLPPGAGRIEELRQTKADGRLGFKGQGLAARISLADLKLNGPFGRIGASGWLALDDRGGLKDYQTGLDLAGFQVPASLWPLLPPGIGRIEELRQARTDGRLDFKGQGLAARISLANLKLNGPFGRIDASGWLDLSGQAGLGGYEADLNLARLKVPGSLRLFLPREMRSAALDGRLSLRGRGLEAKYSLDLGGSTVLGGRIEKLTASGAAGPRAIGLDRLDLAFEGLEARLNGSLWPELGLEAEVSGRVLSRFLERLPSVPALEARGYSFKGTVRGRPAAPAVKGKLLGQGIRFRDLRAAGLDLEVDLPGLPRPAGKVAGSLNGLLAGQLPAFDLKLSASGQPEEASGRLQASGAPAQAETDFSFQRTAGGDFRIVLSGLDLALNLPSGQEAWKAAAPLELAFGPEGLARLNLALAGPGSQKLELSADLAGGRFQGRGQVTRLDLAAWAFLWPEAPVKGGRLDAAVKLSGRPDQPDLSLSGRVASLSLVNQKLDDLDLKAEYRSGRLESNIEIGLAGRRVGHLEATLPLELSLRPWRARVGADDLRAHLVLAGLPASALQPLAGGVERIRGAIKADLTLGPRSEGWIEAQDLGLILSATGQAFDQGQARLTLGQDRLNLEKLRLRTGGDWVDARGFMGLKEGHPFELEMWLDSTDLELGPYGSARIAAHLNLSQTLAQPKVRGWVKIKQLDFKVARTGPEESAEIVVTDRPAPPPLQAPAILDRADLDVALQFVRPGWVEGEGIRAQLKGAVKIAKTSRQPLKLTGRFDIEQGIYSRFGRRFILESGSLVFAGRNPPRPDVEIKAVTRVSSADINLFVSGPLTKPELSLTSQPPMSQEDILAQLLFGRPASGLSQSQSGEIEDQAVSVLGAPASELMKGVLSEKLAPDTLSFSQSTDGGVSVRTGKQILPDLYLSYEAFSEATKPNEFYIEYRLSPHFSIQSNLGDEKTAGVDVFFNYDF